MTKTHERAAAYLAQTPADLLSTLLDEEKQLDFTEFSLDDAWTLGTWLRDAALERGYGVAMSIVFGEQRVFHTATPGASATNDAWLERKFRVLRHFDQSSLGVKYSYEVKGESFDRDARLDPNAYAAAGGAVPLRVRGRLIGAVGVSGLEMHEDHALVVEGLQALLHRREG